MNEGIKQLGSGKYQTDIYNLNPIFLVKNKSSNFSSGNCFIQSWEEALVLNGKPVIQDLNLDYIASFISKVPRSDLSPFLSVI